MRYATPSTLYLEVQNIGQVIIKYSFTPKPDDTGARFCKPWLWVQPPVGMIMPGEKTSISLTVMVDNETAPYLNVCRRLLFLCGASSSSILCCRAALVSYSHTRARFFFSMC